MATYADLLEVDHTTANAARMYDYFLGGSHNFAADREAAERVKALVPCIVENVRSNRDFLGRAVRFCLDQGIDQFLDLGSGIPTVGNVHEIVRRADPLARVAYVDYESVAVEICRSVLAGDPRSSVTSADLRDPHGVLTAPGVADLLDFSRPIALLTVAVMHFVPDADRPVDLLAHYRSRLAPGSLHVLSHLTADGAPAMAAATVAGYRDTANPLHPRTRAQVRELLGEVELVEPGLVDSTTWRPVDDPPPRPSLAYGAVGRTTV